MFKLGVLRKAQTRRKDVSHDAFKASHKQIGRRLSASGQSHRTLRLSDEDGKESERMKTALRHEEEEEEECLCGSIIQRSSD